MSFLVWLLEDSRVSDVSCDELRSSVFISHKISWQGCLVMSSMSRKSSVCTSYFVQLVYANIFSPCSWHGVLEAVVY